MKLIEVGEGAGLTLYGAAFAYVTNRYRLSDRWRERVAESRWGWDRLTSRRARQMGREEWIASFSRSQRSVAAWVGLPFAVVWTALAVALLVRGIVS